MAELHSINFAARTSQVEQRRRNCLFPARGKLERQKTCLYSVRAMHRNGLQLRARKNPAVICPGAC